MLKGGYQILDLKGIDISVTGGAKVEGIYKKIANTKGKPFLLSGLNLGGGIIKDRFVSLDIEDTSYFGMLNASTVIYIDGDDTVSIEEAEPQPSEPVITGLSSVSYDNMNNCWVKGSTVIPNGVYRLGEYEQFSAGLNAYKGSIVIFSDESPHLSPRLTIIGAFDSSGSIGAAYRGSLNEYTMFRFSADSDVLERK